MIDEVAKALKAYSGLDTLGKRLFRDEVGLKRPQQATRRKRGPNKAKTVIPTKGVTLATTVDAE